MTQCISNNKKHINDFKDRKTGQICTFFIPFYQRGYRWTPVEVEALCDDIWEAIQKQPEYCLQPLVVKEKADYEYEVVDGQQRLITIFLILKQIQNSDADIPFSIIFERNNKKDWWNDLSETSCEKHIESYHLFHARKTIETKIAAWSKEKNDERTTRDELYRYIRNNIFFIWHEPEKQKHSEEIFNRINAGKIQLTNAELIKGLLFNPKGETKVDFAELSAKWNEIERVLENDSFWYFLVPRNAKYPSRIEFIWECLYLNVINKGYKTYDKYPIYNFFKKKYEDNPQEFSKNTYQYLKSFFEQLQEWYHDTYKYHAIGFLLEAGYALKDVVELAAKYVYDKTFEINIVCKHKNDIDLKLIKAIKSKIEHFIDFSQDEKKAQEQFDAIDYTEVSDKKKLSHLLLLCNIATLITTKNMYYRFPFDIYKQEGWNVEHIHAIHDKANEEEDHNIRNLALLNEDINKSYKNDDFNDKRDKIFEYEEQGKFIPLCTKNVFLKRYTSSVDQNNSNRWGEQDKDAYRAKMFNVLKNFCLLTQFPVPDKKG